MASEFTIYHKLLVESVLSANTVEVRERSTGIGGVANICEDGKVAVFYGADDGSDDCTITPDEFNERFEITRIIFS